VEASAPGHSKLTVHTRAGYFAKPPSLANSTVHRN
jgi:hypothetical protein